MKASNLGLLILIDWVKMEGVGVISMAGVRVAIEADPGMIVVVGVEVEMAKWLSA